MSHVNSDSGCTAVKFQKIEYISGLVTHAVLNLMGYKVEKIMKKIDYLVCIFPIKHVYIYVQIHFTKTAVQWSYQCLNAAFITQIGFVILSIPLTLASE